MKMGFIAAAILLAAVAITGCTGSGGGTGWTTATVCGMYKFDYPSSWMQASQVECEISLIDTGTITTLTAQGSDQPIAPEDDLNHFVSEAVDSATGTGYTVVGSGIRGSIGYADISYSQAGMSYLVEQVFTICGSGEDRREIHMVITVDQAKLSNLNSTITQIANSLRCV